MAFAGGASTSLTDEPLAAAGVACGFPGASRKLLKVTKWQSDISKYGCFIKLIYSPIIANKHNN